MAVLKAELYLYEMLHKPLVDVYNACRYFCLVFWYTIIASC